MKVCIVFCVKFYIKIDLQGIGLSVNVLICTCNCIPQAMYNQLIHIVFLGSKKRRKGVAKTSHRRIVCRRTVPSPNWHRRNILSPKNPSPKRPSRRKVRRRNVLSPNSPIAESAIAKTSCRRNGVAEQFQIVVLQRPHKSHFRPDVEYHFRHLNDDVA